MKQFSFDAMKESRVKKRSRFKSSTVAERNFAKQLKKVARAAGHIVERHAHGARLDDEQAMLRALNEYAKVLDPWARRQALKMQETVERQSRVAYKNKSKAIGKALQIGVAEQNVGQAAMALLNEQVELIKSIPIEAGLRAQRIAADNFLEGTRAKPDQDVIDQLVNEMGMTTEVATNRAKLIARTETARANASFVQARASALGVRSYIWRTSGDESVRPSHKRMNNIVVEYANPPTLSDGMTGHAGTFPNCRCYQDPILPEE